MAMHFKDQDALNTLVSDTFFPWSNKVTVTQDMINTFADLTGDHMWMHVDVERCAKESPFGKPIAHGFLLLSLLAKFNTLPGVIEGIEGYGHMMNYGSDKLRFPGAVPVDSELHAHSRIKGVEVAPNKTKVTVETHLHIVGQDERPVLIYEMAFVFM